MKHLVILMVLGILMVGCGGESDTATVLGALVPAPGAGNGGGGGGGPVTPPSVSNPAKGRVNGKDFTVKVGYLTTDPFDESKGRIILLESDAEPCSPFADRKVSLPARKPDPAGKYVVSADSMDMDQLPLFYDYAGGENINQYENKKDGLSYEITADAQGTWKGTVSIADDSGTDKNFLVGEFPLVSCL